MEITSLRDLVSSGTVEVTADGIIVKVTSDMVIAGEDRLSYTTILRLVECCREFHWEKDVLPSFDSGSTDSICRSVSARFRRPALVGMSIQISYHVTHVDEREYGLTFSLNNIADCQLCADVKLDNVFFDASSHRATSPPSSVRKALERLVVRRRTPSRK
jgi:acyl-CoA thioesterase FadM